METELVPLPPFNPAPALRFNEPLVVQGDLSGEVKHREIVIQGNVLPGAVVVAFGGGARITIHGNCSKDATVAAEGGGATIQIFGDLV